MEMRQIVCLTGLVALLTCVASADIVNGSFETGDFTGWRTDDIGGFCQVVAGGTHGQWMARLTLEGRYLPDDGGYRFAPASTMLYQYPVDIPADAMYLLFDAWVEGDSYAIASFTEDHLVEVTAAYPTQYAIDLTGIRGLSLELDFLGRDTDVGENYAYLDNVRFTDVPEPGTFGLCLTGILALWTVCRKR